MIHRRPVRSSCGNLNRPGLPEAPTLEDGAIESGRTTNKFSPEVRERAARMAREHQKDYRSHWGASSLVAAKFGCTAETLRNWLRPSDRAAGARAGLSTEERGRLKALQRENRELRRANQILREASAYFDQAEEGAGSNHDRLHRRSPRRLWCRADPRGFFDRSLDISRACGAAPRSDASVATGQARRSLAQKIDVFGARPFRSMARAISDGS